MYYCIISCVARYLQPCFNQQKSMYVLLLHGFCTLHIRIPGRHKIDVINSNVHRNERNLVT